MDWQVGRIVYGPCTVTNGDMSKFTNGKAQGLAERDLVAAVERMYEADASHKAFPLQYDERDAKV